MSNINTVTIVHNNKTYIVEKYMFDGETRIKSIKRIYWKHESFPMNVKLSFNIFKRIDHNKIPADMYSLILTTK